MGSTSNPALIPRFPPPGPNHFKRRPEKGRPGEVGLGPVHLESKALQKPERLQPGPYDKGYSRKRSRERWLDLTDCESPPQAAFKCNFMSLFLTLTDCLNKRLTAYLHFHTTVRSTFTRNSQSHVTHSTTSSAFKHSKLSLQTSAKNCHACR